MRGVYYSFDLHGTRDGQIKILDIHGNSDVLGITAHAGYTPKKERIYRFLQSSKGINTPRRVDSLYRT